MDRFVRWTAVLAVLAVAGVAAWVSYWHAVSVVSAHGEEDLTSRLYPVVIDGLIIAASMVLLDAAQNREAAPRLAWLMLTAGIAATLAVNVLAGLSSGALGAVIAAWPALSFVGCYELLMMLVRAAARRVSVASETADETVRAQDSEDLAEADPAPEFPQASVLASPVPTDAERAAEFAMRAAVHVGNPFTVNQLSQRFKLTRAEATRVRSKVLAEASQDEPEDDAADRPAA